MNEQASRNEGERYGRMVYAGLTAPDVDPAWASLPDWVRAQHCANAAAIVAERDRQWDEATVEAIEDAIRSIERASEDRHEAAHRYARGRLDGIMTVVCLHSGTAAAQAMYAQAEARVRSGGDDGAE